MSVIHLKEKVSTMMLSLQLCLPLESDVNGHHAPCTRLTFSWTCDLLTGSLRLQLLVRTGTTTLACSGHRRRTAVPVRTSVSSGMAAKCRAVPATTTRTATSTKTTTTVCRDVGKFEIPEFVEERIASR